MAETVSDNAPPAVLFRLSYRTQDHYRSGHRCGDSPEQVVESMRGWWETDPRDLDSLAIKHAVAFHAGRTLAVVRIGGWKWHRTKGDEHHTLPVDDLGQPMSEFEWANPPRGVRWAFDVTDDDPMADIAHEAWIGDGGKLVPARLRDTIRSYWPDSPDDSARDLLGKALELLGDSLRLLNEPRFREPWGNDWHERLRQHHRIFRSHRHRASRQDPALQMRILQKEPAAARALLGPTADEKLEDFVATRNRWAHFGDISASGARDDVLKMIDLIAQSRMSAEADRLTIDNERINQHLARLENIHRVLNFQISSHQAPSVPGTTPTTSLAAESATAGS